MNKQERQMQINDGLRECFDINSRKVINFIPIRVNQTKEHFLKICETCYDYAVSHEGFAILCDAKLKGNVGRPDILVLFPDRKKIIEVMCSEEDESIENKIEKYPSHDVEIVRCDE